MKDPFEYANLKIQRALKTFQYAVRAQGVEEEATMESMMALGRLACLRSSFPHRLGTLRPLSP